ncbi:hypothetical protein P8452_76307 [Trifolium repens]|nr:hypothetical protein P8452_76307 [Trifolium repens]
MVRYLQSNSGIKLSSGVSVSQHFGFLQPTRVILSYVIQENTFWMKILPPIQSVKIENTTDPIIVGPSHNEGMQHQTNELGGTSNNQHKPTPTKTQFRKKASLKRKQQTEMIGKCDDQHEEPYLKRSKRATDNTKTANLKSTTRVDKQNKLKATPKKLNKTQKPNSHSRKPIVAKLQPDGSYVWEKVVTEAGTYIAKPQVMHFPKQIARMVLRKNQKKLLLQTEGKKPVYCNIITARRKELLVHTEKFISKEWTKFVRSEKLQVRDKLIFNLQNPPKKMLIQIIRSNAQI